METTLNICLATFVICLSILLICITLWLICNYFILPAYTYITRKAKKHTDYLYKRDAQRFVNIWPMALDIDMADRIVPGSARIDEFTAPDKDGYGRLVIGMTVKKSEEE
ncbi:MAG: hypothetical protein J6B01_04895 [Ruminococcus sp.]|nr:hypothetical protein [Ruminococcus sp.]MBO5319129.1 hypothetical protein [Ruminococcus sp.]